MATDDENLKLTAREIAAAFDTNAGPAIPVILTVDEAAALLRVPKATIYDWSSRGLLKGCCRKVGKHRRFFRDRLVQKAFNDGINDNAK
jgi:excisionase family DNA binding protein